MSRTVQSTFLLMLFPLSLRPTLVAAAFRAGLVGLVHHGTLSSVMAALLVAVGTLICVSRSAFQCHWGKVGSDQLPLPPATDFGHARSKRKREREGENAGSKGGEKTGKDRKK